MGRVGLYIIKWFCRLPSDGAVSKSSTIPGEKLCILKYTGLHIGALIVEFYDTRRKTVYIEIHRPTHCSSYRLILRYRTIPMQSAQLLYYRGRVGFYIIK